MGHASAIVACAKRMRDYSEKLVQGVAAHQFARKPTWGIGGKEIDTNHPAFVYGHLALYPPRLLAACGLKSDIGVPANFPDLFKAGVPCKDDPNGTIYPPMETILSTYFKNTDAALAAFAKLSDADLNKQVADEGMRKHFPTVGEAVLFMLNDHVAMHNGQISAWRRCMGLPGVM